MSQTIPSGYCHKNHKTTKKYAITINLFLLYFRVIDRGRERETNKKNKSGMRDTQKESVFHPLIYSPDAHNRQG